MAAKIDTSRAGQAVRDSESLMLLPAFQRFLFTVLQRSGMFDSAYGSDDRTLREVEGRRSLGFELLKEAELRRPDALLVILQAELHASKGLVDDDRNTDDRSAFLDGEPVDGRRAAASAGYDVIDYSAKP